LSEEVLIDKYLRPLLNANETKFFPTGIKMRVGKKNKTVYYVTVEALGIRHASLRTAFELHGSYAPRRRNRGYGRSVSLRAERRQLRQYQFTDHIHRQTHECPTPLINFSAETGIE